jgi:DNA-binding NtrC family response regulator
MSSPGAFEVLLVEGDTSLEKLLHDALQKEGLSVQAVHTGDEALAAIGARQAPVVVAEVGLEGALSGFDLARALHEIDPDAEVILLTGSDDPRMGVAALRAGAGDLVVKRWEGVGELLLRVHGAEERRSNAFRRGRALRDLTALGDDLLADMASLSKEAMAAGLTTHVATAGAPYRALVVDDEPSTVHGLSSLLQSDGYVVETALSAEEAQPLIESGRFDMLVTDKNLPEKSGLDLIRSVLKTRPDLVAVLMTGYGSMGSAIEAVEAGAGAYLLKPFEDIGQVLARLNDLRDRQLARRRRDRALNAFRARLTAFAEDFSVVRADLQPRAKSNGKSAK